MIPGPIRKAYAFFTSNVSPCTSMESWSSALHSKAERISFGTVITRLCGGEKGRGFEPVSCRQAVEMDLAIGVAMRPV